MNHLKSKGSDCNAVGDPDTGDGSGNCNITRTQAADRARRVAGDGPDRPGSRQRAHHRRPELVRQGGSDRRAPCGRVHRPGSTSSRVRRVLLRVRRPARVPRLRARGHRAASTTSPGRRPWHINSDEPSLIDYDMTFKKPAQDALFAPDAWRSSDHDPVIVGPRSRRHRARAERHGIGGRDLPAEQQVALGDVRHRGDRQRRTSEVTVEIITSRPPATRPRSARSPTPRSRCWLARGPCTPSRSRRPTTRATPRPQTVTVRVTP